MKNYLVVWCFLDMGMEGIPSLTDSIIVEAKNEKEAIKKFPKNIRKQWKGYGCPTVIGEIIDNKVCPRTAYPRCNDWTRDNCLEYRNCVYKIFDTMG